MIVIEMKKRGFNHFSPLDISLAIGQEVQDKYIDSVSQQVEILKNKGCKCRVN